MGEANGNWSAPQDKAGSIKRIRVENFMCHSSLTMELADRVNFITGQNGSGKSAILTALTVAFGIKARGTQRATSLKDFIKNGQSYGAVIVDIKNEGADAFRPDIYGKVITIERRITESGQSFTMKDERGKKVAHKRDDLQELLDHYNIEVENPCVIMTQDKSREFLHAGSPKEKFKFFFKATLLQQVAELLKSIGDNLENANAVVEEMKVELNPFLEELKSLEDQIRSVQQIEVLAQQATAVKKKLAWAWVYNTSEKLQAEEAKLENLQGRISKCQEKIDAAEAVARTVQDAIQVKQSSIQQLLVKTGRLQNSQKALQEELNQATRERAEVEEDLQRKRREIERSTNQLRRLEQQVEEILQKHVQSTEAEASEREQQFMVVNQAIEAKRNDLRNLMAEEADLQLRADSASQQVASIRAEMDEFNVQLRDCQGHIRRLEQQRKNQMTAFGGDKVLQLLQSIENRQLDFSTPPIGPIGSHLTLVDGTWSLAVEVAVGKLLDTFIVANHRDMLTLRQIASRVNYSQLQIIIYDFDQTPLRMLPDQLPDPSLVTVMSVLQTDNTVVMNCLIDQGGIERQVLAADYDEGKRFAFGNGRLNENVREVFTKDGLKMFARGGSETTLPRDRRVQGRLGIGIEEQQNEASAQLGRLRSSLHASESRKRSAEDSARNYHGQLQSVKRRRVDLQRAITSDELRLRELENAARAESTLEAEPDVGELDDEMAKAREEIQRNQDILVKMQFKVERAQEKVSAARSQVEGIRESARGDIEASEIAEQELLSLQEELDEALRKKANFENIMQVKVLADIKIAEKTVSDLEAELAENRDKALQVCPEEDVMSLGGVDKSIQELSANLTKLNDRVRREEEQNEPLEELLDKRNSIERRITKKQLLYDTFQRKLEMLNDAFKKRCSKFERNCVFLRRQLTWQFNSHLRKKGFSGSVRLDYQKETLSLEVQMPQDASGSAVRDTRALSGGERSYSTLSFALALHDMTEAPFRAMDEFDVFMDAVSRKISLDTVVDFAVTQGSQWIFITPHDISSVKAGPFVRKQQMSAPRP